jgi:hypothetical protein
MRQDGQDPNAEDIRDFERRVGSRLSAAFCKYCESRT